MPSIGITVFIATFLTWWFGLLTWQWFISFWVFWYLWDEVLPKLFKGFGFVSKEKYQSLSKDKKQVEAELKQAEEKIEILEKNIEYMEQNTYDEDDIHVATINGQNAVFSQYLYNQQNFLFHLAAYKKKINQNRDEEDAKRKQSSNTTNKKGEPLWHTVLGVTRLADFETTKKAYRELCKRYHPDRPDGSEEKMKEINNAWSVAEKHFGKA